MSEEKLAEEFRQKFYALIKEYGSQIHPKEILMAMEIVKHAIFLVNDIEKDILKKE
jgi:hypothetical protein